MADTDPSAPRAPMEEGRITDEALAALKRRIGAKMRIKNLFNQLASKDAIRHFADGIGDPNPLWREEEYAKSTRFGRILAPPSWIFSVFPAWILQGLPGVGGFHSGSETEHFKVIKEGDFITPECVFAGFEEKPSKFAGRMIKEYQEGRYFNQKSDLVAKTNVWIFRIEKAAGREKKKYYHLQLPHPWREDELREIENQVLAEEIRGANPRYWEDVAIGDELGPVIKGPLGLTDIVAYCVGAAPIDILAHHVALKKYREHPAWSFRDPATSALEPIYGVHYNKAAANAMGLPYSYDVGIQRHCWLIHLLTNWTGDDGWIKRTYAEYRHFVYLSDVVWLRGKVMKKYAQDDEFCVDVETSAINQRGEDTMPGRATIVLPSRQGGRHPLDGRIDRP